MSKNVAIVLAAGQGKRMQTETAKQFLEIKGKLLVCYALEIFEACEIIDEIVLVTNETALEYCRKEVKEKYGYKKITEMIAGGRERYDSVYQGLQAIETADYVFIHDGARPFLTQELVIKLYSEVKESGACVAAVPVKDTIKVADQNLFSKETPKRSTLWQIQTPQVFDFNKIRNAYQRMVENPVENITDDAMVMEQFGDCKVKLCQADYRNIKVTTPEDLAIAAAFLN